MKKRPAQANPFAHPFDPTRIPMHAELQLGIAESALAKAKTPDEVAKANRLMMRAIADEDLMREHCE